jgi:hypothetical protein
MVGWALKTFSRKSSYFESSLHPQFKMAPPKFTYPQALCRVVSSICKGGTSGDSSIKTVISLP